MLIIWDDIAAMDAGLTSVPLATQDQILMDVRAMVPLGAWDVRYLQAQKYLAAHLGVLSERARLGGINGGPAGPVTSESLDGASRSYAAPASGSSTTDPSFALTSWGQMYSMLLMMNIARLPMVI